MASENSGPVGSRRDSESVPDSAKTLASESLARIVEVMPDATFVVRNGIVIAGNEPLLQLLEIPNLTSLLGRSWEEFFPAKLRDATRTRAGVFPDARHDPNGAAMGDLGDDEGGTLGGRESSPSRKSRGPLTGAEIDWLDSRGRTQTLRVLAAPAWDEGQPVTLVFLRDVSECRRLAAQVRQAQRFEALGRFAGGVAHDFNNLLTVVLGYCELLQSRLDLDPLCGVAFSAIRESGERAAGLTRRLLSFGRLQQFEPIALDLNQMIAGTERILRRVVGEDVQFATRLAPGLALTKVDPGQIEHVLFNLVIAARDAMPTGGFLLLHTANVTRDLEPSGSDSSESAPATFVQLSVHDSGEASPTRATNLDPCSTPSPPAESNDLAIAVAREIVSHFGGTIEVEHHGEQGHVYRLLLPATDKPSQIAPTPAALGSPDRGCETILIVDDEPAVRRVAVQTMQTLGYVVLEAANAKEALRRLENHPRDVELVITDVVMPGLNGRQLADILASHSPRTRILFVSGYSNDAILRHGIEQSEIAFLAKPYTPQSLARKVRQVLDAP